MTSYSFMRPIIWASVWAAASLAAPVSFGAAANPQQAQAQVLDRAEFLCANCFFGASDYYYCFAVDNQILIAYQRTRVLNYQDQSKNYLAPVRPRWAAWSAPGQTVPISYDDKNIWVSREEHKPEKQGFWAHVKGFGIWASRGDSKQVKLTRSSMGDIFTNDDRCRHADGAAAH
jgi:hypothetical protein